LKKVFKSLSLFRFLGLRFQRKLVQTGTAPVSFKPKSAFNASQLLADRCFVVKRYIEQQKCLKK